MYFISFDIIIPLAINPFSYKYIYWFFTPRCIFKMVNKSFHLMTNRENTWSHFLAIKGWKEFLAERLQMTKHFCLKIHFWEIKWRGKDSEER